MVSQAELILKGYYSLVPGLISIFLETVWVPLRHTPVKQRSLYFILNQTRYKSMRAITNKKHTVLSSKHTEVVLHSSVV